MKIRSITCFYNPVQDTHHKTLDSISRMCHQLIIDLEKAGYEIQTTRLATNPYPHFLSTLDIDKAIGFSMDLEKNAIERGFHYLSIGPALLTHPSSYDLVLPLLKATQNTFLSGEIANHKEGISLEAIHTCAGIIDEASSITPDGFTNLRFACLANVFPSGPFFPSSYHLNPSPSFSLALECADLALDAFKEAESISIGRENLLSRLEQEGVHLSEICEKQAVSSNVAFSGLDFSYAPFPEPHCSIGGAIEQLGVPKIGLFGSVAAAAILAEVLDKGSWKKAGFNGLMFPVLEDDILALRSSQKFLTIKDLLLFSTVCGTGLDTVPLPGNTPREVIASILLDVAALALRLDKPLTARLMPVPGKAAGDITDYDFEYFQNGGVMDVPLEGLNGLFTSSETFKLQPRSRLFKAETRKMR